MVKGEGKKGKETGREERQRDGMGDMSDYGKRK